MLLTHGKKLTIRYSWTNYIGVIGNYRLAIPHNNWVKVLVRNAQIRNRVLTSPWLVTRGRFSYTPHISRRKRISINLISFSFSYPLHLTLSPPFPLVSSSLITLLMRFYLVISVRLWVDLVIGFVIREYLDFPFDSPIKINFFSISLLRISSEVCWIFSYLLRKQIKDSQFLCFFIWFHGV